MEEKGQTVSVAPAGESLRLQLGGRTAVGVTAVGTDLFISGRAFGISAALAWLLPDALQPGRSGAGPDRVLELPGAAAAAPGNGYVLARLSELRGGDARHQLAGAVSATALSTPSCVRAVRAARELLARPGRPRCARTAPARPCGCS